MALKDLPKHPLARNTQCPVCGVQFETLPVRRGVMPDDHSQILEQHVCPNGHVYQTEIGKDQMISTW